MWLEIPGFKEKLQNWWEKCIVEGTPRPSYKFEVKLKMLKDCILKWKKKEFGEIEERKISCLNQIQVLDNKSKSRWVRERGARKEGGGKGI